MTDSNQAALKTLLQQWFSERQQVLRTQVLQALGEDLDRSVPDPAFLERLLAAAAPPPPTDWDAALGLGLDQMEAADNQAEVLKFLLDGLRPFSERSALFILKGGLATLYAQRGFETDHPRLGVPVVAPPELEGLIQGATALLQAPGPAYRALLEPLGPRQAPAMRIIPLHLRRKTVALLLVDSGTEDALARPNHVRAMALGAEARLAFLARGKAEERAPREGDPRPARLPQAATDIRPVPAEALDPVVRANAERSARVLVGDMELYFPAKVSQGQSVGNLYGAMRDELDRSRASFVERYGSELESLHQIFYKTVVQQLCAGDPSRLGPAPWAAR